MTTGTDRLAWVAEDCGCWSSFCWCGVLEEMSSLRTASFCLVRRQTSAGWPWHCIHSSRLCPFVGSHRPGDDGNAFSCDRTSSMSRILRLCSYTPTLRLAAAAAAAAKMILWHCYEFLRPLQKYFNSLILLVTRWY